ncbi:CCA tRNA nucleotidyltransferase [Sphingomonas colocasiae]|uniref:CCA tRNA nucleotidyltransferase n=1 Tax=Sphingomonas colocasiae TaxID=1848973 RepID=UPI001FE2D0E0|nr:CCA tRNA nucleotidyltransferase [Sphingomonas colocasiae]
MDGVTLPEAAWRTREGLDRLLQALGADDGLARYVGGAVRDTIMGIAVNDIDIATPLAPDDAMRRLQQAGIKVIPTGIAHGTVTAVLADGPIEITTLRRDVSTDGRRATVAFSNDWREDAARRDFTINALYADPLTGAVFDYFGGLADLEAGRIRFIGDALTRIAEDHLRILRFFRFHARFGRGAPDAEALTACRQRARDLMALSRERIADELTKLLALPDPFPTIALMLENGILAPALPEIDQAGLDRLGVLLSQEREIAASPDAVRRLIALLPQDTAAADGVASRLRLSNAQRKRIAAALAPDPSDPVEALYRLGHEGALDRLLLATDAAAQWARIRDRDRPVFPLRGGTLVARGLTAGPRVAQAMQAIERRWIEEGFPGETRIGEIADAEVDQLLRATR